MIVPSQVVGVWSLHSFDDLSGDISETGPLGQYPEGLLIYCSNYYMSVTMMRKTGEIEKPSDQKFMAYAGSWRMSGGIMYHKLICAQRPEMMATEQMRYIKFDDNNTLVIEGEVKILGELIKRKLVWHRLSTSSII